MADHALSGTKRAVPAPVGVRDAISAALALALMLPAPAAALPRLHAADGELRDEQGRSVMLRGVNLPWGLRVPEVAARPSVPADQDAAQMATLGFDVARRQLSWKAIEPGHAGPNDPSICTPGPPADPGQWDRAHA